MEEDTTWYANCIRRDTLPELARTGFGVRVTLFTDAQGLSYRQGCCSQKVHKSLQSTEKTSFGSRDALHTFNHQLQTQAITLLRRWDTATDERERAYCMKACKAFLNGEDPDLEMKMNAVGSEHKAGPGHAAHGSGYVAQIDKLDEFQKKEMLILRKAYHNHWIKRITLINKDCYTLVPEDFRTQPKT